MTAPLRAVLFDAGNTLIFLDYARLAQEVGAATGLALTAAAVALLSSALPYALEMIALRALPTRTFSILMSLEPAVAALCGLLFLGAHLGVAQWAAIVLVIAASLGATMTASQTSAPVEV